MLISKETVDAILDKQNACKHVRREYPENNNNRDGKYYDYVCKDCGYKKLEGRSFAHKELAECCRLLKYQAGRNRKKCIRVLRLIHAMTADALNRLDGEGEKFDKYYNNVF